MDKEKAIIQFLLGCPQIRDNPLFFNFLNAKDNNKQLVTIANDKAINKAYIDGSVLRRYTFTLIDYRTVAYQAVVKTIGTGVPSYPNENLEEYLDIQSMLDWVNQQADAHNYPNFGTDCVIEDMWTSTDQPTLNGVDTNVKPALAKYSISIQIDYLDISKRLWN